MSQHGKKKDTTKGQTRPKNTGAPCRELLGHEVTTAFNHITFLAVPPFSSHGTLAFVASLGQRLALGGWMAPVGLAWIMDISTSWTWRHTHTNPH